MRETIPGVGAIVALTFRAAVAQPGRAHYRPVYCGPLEGELIWVFGRGFWWATAMPRAPGVTMRLTLYRSATSYWLLYRCSGRGIDKDVHLLADQRREIRRTECINGLHHARIDPFGRGASG